MRIPNWLLAIIGLAALTFPARTTAEPMRSSARLQGTFIQLFDDRFRWTDDNWEELFQTFRRIGMKEIIIQWSAYGERDYSSPPADQLDADSPVERLLSFADQNKVKVYVGLVEDPRYWEWLNGDTATLAASLRALNARSIALARRNAPFFRKHRSFAGWYISQEIHDASWQTEERRGMLLNLLGDLSSQLHELAPGRDVVLSGFTTSQSNPTAVEAFWNSLFKSAEIGTVLFQDGIGVGNLSLELLPAYLDAVRRSTDRNGRRLGVVIELFDQQLIRPGTIRPFEAVPAAIDRIGRQLSVAERFGKAVAFSVPEYMSPLAGPAAKLLLDDYIRLMQ